MEARCVRCGAAFACGADDPTTPCWCAGLPPVAPARDAQEGCLCPRCLEAEVARLAAAAAARQAGA